MLDISERKFHEKENLERLKTQQAQQRFERLAKTAPVGMYLVKPNGDPIYLNDAYHDIVGLPKGQELDIARLVETTIDPDHIPRVTEAWADCIERGIPLDNLEYKLLKEFKTYDSATGTELTGSTWLQSSAFVERDEDGNVIAVQGFVYDISIRKFTEKLLAERLEEALEHKRQADRFIE